MANYKSAYTYIWSTFFFSSLVLAVPIAKMESSKLPSFVKICRRNDPNLDKCMRNSLNSLKDRLQDGIPELHVPALEPLIIPEIKMNQDTGAVYMKSTYKNAHINGLSKFNIKSLNIDPSKMKFTTNLTFKNVTIKADYEIDGKIMMMPLTGTGTCNVNFTDVDLTIVVLGERQKKQGNNYMKIKDIKVNYDVGKVKLNLKDLFNGDNAMGERMNSFLNENWDSLSEELKPLLEKSLSEVLHSTTDKLFKTYSYDDLLPL